MLAWVAGFVMCGFLLVRAAVCAACSWQLRIKVQRQGLHCTHLMQIGPVNYCSWLGFGGRWLSAHGYRHMQVEGDAADSTSHCTVCAGACG